MDYSLGERIGSLIHSAILLFGFVWKSMGEDVLSSADSKTSFTHTTSAVE